MNPKFRRMLALAIGLLTGSEVLILHWGWLAFRGAGFDLATASLVALALGASNALLFPAARRRWKPS